MLRGVFFCYSNNDKILIGENKNNKFFLLLSDDNLFLKYDFYI